MMEEIKINTKFRIEEIVLHVSLGEDVEVCKDEAVMVCASTGITTSFVHNGKRFTVTWEDLHKQVSLIKQRNN